VRVLLDEHEDHAGELRACRSVSGADRPGVPPGVVLYAVREAGFETAEAFTRLFNDDGLRPKGFPLRGLVVADE
jgi:hypothetical protein